MRYVCDQIRLQTLIFHTFLYRFAQAFPDMVDVQCHIKFIIFQAPRRNLILYISICNVTNSIFEFLSCNCFSNQIIQRHSLNEEHDKHPAAGSHCTDRNPVYHNKCQCTCCHFKCAASICKKLLQTTNQPAQNTVLPQHFRLNSSDNTQMADKKCRTA